MDLLNILGRSYLIDHCVCYFKHKKEERDFRINITEVTRGILGVLTGKWEDIPRFVDTIKPPEPSEELTEQKVISNIRKKLGG